MTRLRLGWLVWFLSVLIAVPVSWGATPAAVLGAADAAYVNGHSKPSGTMLALGDQVATRATGAVTVQFVAASVELGHKTVAAVAAQGLKLERGYAHVRGAAELSAGPYSCRTGKSGEYEMVLLANGRAYLHVMNGSLALKGFARPMTLKAGTAITYTMPPQTQEHPVKASDQAPKNNNPLLIAVAVVGAAAIAAGLALNSGHSSSASPTQP